MCKVVSGQQVSGSIWNSLSSCSEMNCTSFVHCAVLSAKVFVCKFVACTHTFSCMFSLLYMHVYVNEIVENVCYYIHLYVDLCIYCC